MSYAAVLLVAPVAFVLAEGRHPSGAPSFYIENSENFAFQSLEDDQGGFYLLWTHGQATSYALLVQRVDAEGHSLWPVTAELEGCWFPSVDSWTAVPDGKGGIVIAWQENSRIRAQRIGPGRQLLWPKEAYLVSISTHAERNPIATPDGLGGAYLVWEEKLYADRWVLLAQHINPQGAALWPAEGVRISLRPSDQRWPSASYDGQGGFISAWKDSRESASQVMAQRVDFQGNLIWGTQGRIVTAPAGNTPDRPVLDGGGDGSALLAWTAPQGGANGIFMQRVDASSGAVSWTPQGVSVSPGSWDRWNPRILGDGEGGAWVAWIDYRNQIKWQAYVQHVGKDGKPEWPAQAVAPGPGSGDQGHIVLAEDGQDGVFAAWLDNRSGTAGVYIQELDSDGQLLRGPEGRMIADGFKDPATPQLANVAPGEAVVSWADRSSKGQWALYWEKVKKIK